MKYELHLGDCLDVMRGMGDCSVQCCVTSPPYYGLRDYGHDGQIGLEPTPEGYVAKMVDVFREVRRVLRDDGTVWLNLGDSYSGSCKGVWNVSDDMKLRVKEAYRPSINPIKSVTVLKPKDLIGIPWRVAFALQSDGWWLRQDIIWHKPNPMPESVTDRCTKAHEYLFLLSKSARYYFDADAMKEDSVSQFNDKPAAARGSEAYASASGLNGNAQLFTRKNDGTRNRRSVWTVTTKPFKGAHFATFPPDLITPCILAGAPIDGVVFDPFTGSGTTGMVAMDKDRRFVGIELNPEYYEMARARIEHERTRPRQPDILEGMGSES